LSSPPESLYSSAELQIVSKSPWESKTRARLFPVKPDQILLSFLEKRGPSVFSAEAVYGEANTAEFEAKSLL